MAKGCLEGCLWLSVQVAGTALDLDLRSLLEVSQNSLPPRSLLQTRTNDPSPKKLSAESPSQKRARPKERPAVPKQMPQRPLTKKQRLDINSKAGRCFWPKNLTGRSAIVALASYLETLIVLQKPGRVKLNKQFAFFYVR